MTKLEQVARAIQASDFEDGGIPWENINPEGQSDYLKDARAAAEALRRFSDGYEGLTPSEFIDDVLNENPNDKT